VARRGILPQGKAQQRIKVETFDCGSTKPSGIRPRPAARRGSIPKAHGAAAHPTTSDSGSAAGTGSPTGSQASLRMPGHLADQSHTQHEMVWAFAARGPKARSHTSLGPRPTYPD
jgi:hypothetical protein